MRPHLDVSGRALSLELWTDGQLCRTAGSRGALEGDKLKIEVDDARLSLRWENWIRNPAPQRQGRAEPRLPFSANKALSMTSTKLIIVIDTWDGNEEPTWMAPLASSRRAEACKR